jgi:hypothetical protein
MHCCFVYLNQSDRIVVYWIEHVQLDEKRLHGLRIIFGFNRHDRCLQRVCVEVMGYLDAIACP